MSLNSSWIFMVLFLLIMSYYLMIHDEPPIIVFDAEKNLYYAALKAFDVKEEIVPLKKFLEMEAVQTWGKTLEREQVGTKKRRIQIENR